MWGSIGVSPQIDEAQVLVPEGAEDGNLQTKNIGYIDALQGYASGYQ